jgi:hypothetical protein
MYDQHQDQELSKAVTHDSFDEVARAANKDVGQTSNPVERSKELISSLRETVSSCPDVVMLRSIEEPVPTYPQTIVALTAARDALAR